MTRRDAAGIVLLAATWLPGCGYHVAGHANTLPKNLKTIAVLPFSNLTTRYKLSDRLPAAITREFISRTRYRVVSDADGADAVLSGAVIQYAAYPTVFNPATGRASAMQVNVQLQLTLKDRATGAVLFSRQHVELRERYEISVDPGAYVDESDVALERLSQDVARMVVSAVLENF